MPTEQFQPTVIIKNGAWRKAKPFAAVPTRIIRNAELSIAARLTYALLLSYAHQDGFCFPAQERLGADLGKTERHVRRFLIELREKGYIDWKQQGFNRPNIYFILEIEPSYPTPENSNEGEDRTQTSGPVRTSVSAPDRTPRSAQERTFRSDYREPATKKHKVVNDVSANDQKWKRPSARKGFPTISTTALRSKYGLSDAQIGRVHWLVEQQGTILGALERNHAHYVDRAAEAVRDGLHHLLDHTLGDFKQASTDITIANKPGYFVSMWREALARHTRPAAPPTTESPRPIDNLAPPDDSPPSDARARMIANAHRRGFPIPNYIRTADIGSVGRWWAALPECPTRKP